jgi:hypothetical protein
VLPVTFIRGKATCPGNTCRRSCPRSGRPLGINVNANARAYANFNSGLTETTPTANTQLVLNAYNSVLVVRDDQAKKLYCQVNGGTTEEVSYVGTPSPLSNAQATCVGGDFDFGQTFDGMVDELLCYRNTCLQASQRATLTNPNANDPRSWRFASGWTSGSGTTGTWYSK